MERISIDKRIIEEVIRYITSKPNNIYCEVAALIRLIEQDAQPIEEPKPKEEEEVAQA